MSQSNTRRVVGGLSAFAVAAGFAVTAGVGMAAAAPGSITWSDGASTFTRTIDNATPAGDDTVTVTTKWARTDANWEKLSWAKDYHPTCLTYVPGSAKVTDAAGVHTIEPYVETAADYTAVDFTTLGYQPTSKRDVDTPVLSIQYKVGYGCDRGTALATGLAYNGSRGAGTYTDKGPSVTVAKNVSTAILAAVPADVKVGQSVPLSATVTGGADGNVVEFYDGATKFGQGSLAAGEATFVWAPAAAGAHSLTAKFLGTTKANESVSAAQNVPVAPADVVTTTEVTGPDAAVAGTDVTLDVQVSPPPSGGMVQFKDGATDLGGPVALDAQGKGSITQQFATGTRSITAVYAGAGEFLTSTSAAHMVTVTDPAPVDVATTTALTLPVDVKTGVAVDLWAAVKGPNGDLIPSGGQVTFKDGGTVIGTAADVVDGEANVHHTFATAGTHNITAEFSGATGYLASVSVSGALEVTDPAPTDVATATVLTLPATATKGVAVDLVATVSPALAGGTLQFMDGATAIGAPVGLVDGKATLSYAFPITGDRHVTAVYSGAPGYLGSTAAVGTVTVTEAGTGGGDTGSAGSSAGSLGNLFGSS
ncbi:Ig-like domain-containing protein [Rhodococcus tukisamuensis]|uniref:Ig-like domain (Group 3) n=1 Tax=Rhodococcus tukisamuensis TaxID=168276 RepID=A0A1G6PJX2_9NOCA|nr:Ig-like domain-containing protein [Rhodococcus tukisamuensis]SDC80542.1 Ig-like domain (group 3) [Rhodococcus tukisamuensis]